MAWACASTVQICAATATAQEIGSGRSGVDEGPQRVAADVLHHQVEAVEGGVETGVVDLRDAVMLDACGDPGFPLEAAGEFVGVLVGGDGAGADEFDGDFTVEDGVVAAPHLAHAAGLDVLDQLVPAGDRF